HASHGLLLSPPEKRTDHLLSQPDISCAKDTNAYLLLTSCVRKSSLSNKFGERKSETHYRSHFRGASTRRLPLKTGNVSPCVQMGLRLRSGHTAHAFAAGITTNQIALDLLEDLMSVSVIASKKK